MKRKIGSYVGADRIETGLSQRNLARIAEEKREADRLYEIYGGEDEEIQCR